MRVDGTCLGRGVEAVEHRAKRGEQKHRERHAQDREHGAPLAPPRALQNEGEELHAAPRLTSHERALLEVIHVAGARSAAWGSCVTMMIVFLNSWLSRCRSVRISSPTSRRDRRSARQRAAASDRSRRAGDRDTLFLPARKLARIVRRPIAQTDDVERGHHVIAPLLSTDSSESSGNSTFSKAVSTGIRL